MSGATPPQVPQPQEVLTPTATSKRRSSSASKDVSTPASTALNSVQKRRSSTRSIKRKKFDDELVESSLTPSQPKIEKIIKAKAGLDNKASSSSSSATAATAAPTTAVTTAAKPSSAAASTSAAVTSSKADRACVTTTTTSSCLSPSVTSVTTMSPAVTPPITVVSPSLGDTPTDSAVKTSSPVAVSSQGAAQVTLTTQTTVSGSQGKTVQATFPTVTTTTIKTTPLTISVPALEAAAAALEARQQTPATCPVSKTCSPSSVGGLLTTVIPTPPGEPRTPAPSTPLMPSPTLTESRGKRRDGKTGSGKRSKKATKPPPAASNKDLGRWKPQDDLLLITAVQQTCDLTAVYLGCKFSCKFTLREIQERWYALLYDPVLSKLSIQAMSQLHQDVITQVETQALYSRAEEGLLGTIASNYFQNSQPNIAAFEDMLNKNATVFHPTRTAKELQTHWLLMRQYHLLPDQTVQPMPKGDHVLNFSDAEDMINDDELREVKDEELEHELGVADRRQKKEIRHLECELPKWQVLVDSVTGISPQEFDNQTLAVLRGRLVRYLMRSKEITLGRSTKDNPIDVDLTLEGPAWKISRRQGVIKLKNNGDFFIANEGKRPIYVDGKPVIRGAKHKLSNNSVVELSCLRFIFLINMDLISMIRQEAQKLP